MKNLFNLLFLLCFLTPLSVIAADGKGNGTDFLETLFAKAKVMASENLNSIDVADIKYLPISKRNKKWLSKDHPDFDTNLEALQVYISSLSISFKEFGEGGCEDPDSDNTHGICFYDDDPRISKVIISKDRNTALLAHLNDQDTELIDYTDVQINKSLQLAMAMLIHEAGHFVGEKHHIKLDNLGAQIAAIPSVKQRTKLKKYSTSPLIDHISGQIIIDEYSMSVSVADLKLKGKSFYHEEKVCKLLGLGAIVSFSKTDDSKYHYWITSEDVLSLSSGSQQKAYYSVVCELEEK